MSSLHFKLFIRNDTHAVRTYAKLFGQRRLGDMVHYGLKPVSTKIVTNKKMFIFIVTLEWQRLHFMGERRTRGGNGKYEGAGDMKLTATFVDIKKRIRPNTFDEECECIFFLQTK